MDSVCNLTRKTLFGALLALAGIATANAYVITESTVPYNPAVGNPAVFTSGPSFLVQSGGSQSGFSVDWLCPASVCTTQALSATAAFTVNSLSASQLELGVTVTNTVPNTFQASILAIGIGVNPDATATITPDATPIFDGVSAGSGPNQTFPGGFKEIDVCAYAANGCTGGSINQGLLMGASDSFVLTLAGAFDPAIGVNLSQFAIKFQTANGSFEFPGGGGGGPPVTIPEPGSIALLGIVALAGGLVMSRRRRNVA